MFSPSAIVGFRSLFVRVALLVTVLAVPILGTSYSLVSQLSADISMATAEAATLADFAPILELFSLLGALHDRIARRDRVGILATQVNVERVLSKIKRNYGRAGRLPKADPLWATLDERALRLKRDPSLSNVAAVMSALPEIGNTLEGNSPLDLDPNSAVQWLSDAVLRHEPRSIAALRQTAEAVALAGHTSLDPRNAQSVAARRALESQAITGTFVDVENAMSLEPPLRTRLGPPLAAARATTQEFEGRVDRLLATLNRDPGNVPAIEAAAQRAGEAHLQLWREARSQAERFVELRRDAQLVRRRIAIAFALLAIAAGAFAVTFMTRHMARRDRLELAAAKLEADRLRAELSRMSVERALRLQEAQFRTVFENADLGIAIFDPQGRTRQHNTAAKHILGFQIQSVLDGQLSSIAKFASSNHESFTRDESRTTDDNRRQWLSLTFSGVYDEDVCQMVIMLIRDATEEKLLAQQLAHDASHDSLTGLANRSAFDAALRALLVECTSDSAFALMYIDLDNFKPVNDTFGHRAGDHVLRTIADRLRSVVAAQDICARLGGDEFAVLLRDVSDRAQIDAIAERTATSVALPITYHDTIELRVTASIGIAVGSARSGTADELKHDADLALYAVKERGRNGHLIHGRAFEAKTSS